VNSTLDLLMYLLLQRIALFRRVKLFLKHQSIVERSDLDLVLIV